jgi:SOS-response transcriptional repressor LexA
MTSGARVTVTARQADDRLGRWPSVRELGVELGIASSNGVSELLRALERKGFVRAPTRRGHHDAWQVLRLLDGRAVRAARVLVEEQVPEARP